MPGKPRHGKGRNTFQSKKRREHQRTQAPVIQTQVAAQPAKAAASTGLPATRVKAPVTSPTARHAGQYPYIATELRRIAILTSIILAILVVLSLVLT